MTDKDTSYPGRITKGEKRKYDLLCQEMGDWLKRNMHPHAVIVVGQDNAGLYEGVIAWVRRDGGEQS